MLRQRAMLKRARAGGTNDAPSQLVHEEPQVQRRHEDRDDASNLHKRHARREQVMLRSWQAARGVLKLMLCSVDIGPLAVSNAPTGE